MQEAPLSRSHPKNGWGLNWLFFRTVCPCELGADSCELVESTAADRATADKRRGGMSEGNAREAASLQEAPPSRSHPKNGWGLNWFFFRTVCPCGVGAVFCE